jgi:hypothetical protein
MHFHRFCIDLLKFSNLRLTISTFELLFFTRHLYYIDTYGRKSNLFLTYNYILFINIKLMNGNNCIF